MPLPKKKSGESKDEFVSRCMINQMMINDFPDEKQRLAVCYSQTENRAGEKIMSEKKNKNPRIETRSIVGGECRAVDGGEGIVEAHLTKWDAVDSYNSSFSKGSFIKTFQTRGASGIRLFWNHKELAGKILEVREDAYGPFVKVKFNLETRAGKDAYEHVKAGDVNCFSFGFNTIKDSWVSGVRTIQEVDMLECGPVIFQANDEAKITDVREGEERAENFNQTFSENDLRSRGYKLMNALDQTIDDIFWGSGTGKDEIISLTDVAISDFHNAFISWLQEWYGQYEERTGLPPREIRNSIQNVMNGIDFGNLTGETSLTTKDVETLKKGSLLSFESRGKLNDLPEELKKAHQIEREKQIETLCSELRASGLNQAEKERLFSLLSFEKREDKNEDIESNKTSDVEKAISFLSGLRDSF